MHIGRPDAEPKMSNLDLLEFHSFLEQLIDDSCRDGRFSVDKIIGTILTRHSKRVAKIQDQVNDLGLRALIRNNCRAKKSASSAGPDIFGYYRLGKLVSVPYKDERGKLRWDKKRRSQLSLEEFDGIRAHWADRPPGQSKERRDFDEIARRIKPYRKKANSVAEALEMAQRDGK
jgi:hypothetical protein